MKFTKRTFPIKIIKDGAADPAKEVSGLVGNLFGIHKNPYGRFAVSHLRTGVQIYTFKKQKEAKQFVERAEMATFPETWEQGDLTIDFGDETFMRLAKNGNKCRQILEGV